MSVMHKWEHAATRPQIKLQLSLSQAVGSQPPLHLYSHEGPNLKLTTGRIRKLFLACTGHL